MLLLKIVQLDRIGCMKCDVQDLPERQDVSEIPLVEDIIQYHQKAIDILKRPGKIADKKTQVKDVVDDPRKGENTAKPSLQYFQQ